jgi:hypothetical protein
MKPHPEGGYFKETYRSLESVQAKGLPERYQKDRNLATVIYYLLESGDFSSFHRIKSDETWFHHFGCPMEIFIIERDGSLRRELIGDTENLKFATSNPGGQWIAARPSEKQSFSLVSCAVFPGFEYDDFEMGSREGLIQSYPDHGKIIKELTRA